MYQGYPVVVVCPAGRRDVADIMRRYVERERPVVDELNWWMNTDNVDDREYFYGLHRAAPDFHRPIELPGPGTFGRRHMTISRFFRTACVHGAVYVRIDDDVVWMDDRCIEHLVAHRIAHPDAYLVYGNIVNSSRFMHLHQQAGAFDPGFKIAYEINHATNRQSTPAALAAHRSFLLTAEALARTGDRTVLKPWMPFERHCFAGGEHNDCNMISWFGHDFAAWRGICPPGIHEEVWICLRMPFRHGCRTHEACGAALCAHYASVPQWAGLSSHAEILRRYRALQPHSDIVPLPAPPVTEEDGYDPAVVSIPRDDAVS
jgi:hypothetical protein